MELKKEQRDVYDLLELLELMEKKGFMSKRRYLNEHVYDSYNFANDIHLDMSFCDGDDDEINAYHEEVRRILGIEEDECVLMEVSW